MILYADPLHILLHVRIKISDNYNLQGGMLAKFIANFNLKKLETCQFFLGSIPCTSAHALNFEVSSTLYHAMECSNSVNSGLRVLLYALLVRKSVIICI